VRDGVSDRQRGFLYENVGDIGGSGSSCCSSSSSSSSTRKSQEIHELIVATKTHTTVEALRAIRGRLGPWSTLLFLQNGIGAWACFGFFLASHRLLGLLDLLDTR